MQNKLRFTLRTALRLLFKGPIARSTNTPFQRAWIRVVAGVSLRARGSRFERGDWGGPGEWVSHRDSHGGRVVLYLHGGGYTIGAPGTHRSLTSHLAVAARAQVLVPDYRLAPEHPYPAALEDVLSAYRVLLERFGARNIAFAGDSAGGGLALCTALAVRDAGLPMPAALMLISPWVDLTASGESHRTLKDADPMLAAPWMHFAIDAYRGALAPGDPRVSPLFADLSGLPPMLIQVGSDEILLSDSQALHARALAAGVNVRLEVETGLWHVYQLHAGLLRASDAAIGRIAKFLHEHWGAAT